MTSPARAVSAIVAELPGVVVLRGLANLTLCTWHGQATGRAAELVTQTMDRPELRGRRQSFIHVIHTGLPLPDAEARQVFMNTMKERANDLACVAVVVLGTGFWASAMRNAVIGMRVFAPRAFEFRVFGTCDEVVDWLPTANEKLAGVALAPEALRALLSAPEPG